MSGDDLGQLPRVRLSVGNLCRDLHHAAEFYVLTNEAWCQEVCHLLGHSAESPVACRVSDRLPHAGNVVGCNLHIEPGFEDV